MPSRSQPSAPASCSTCSPTTPSGRACRARMTCRPRFSSGRTSTRRPARSTSRAPRKATRSPSRSSRSSRPAHSWRVAHIPYFGGLTGTDRTALLNEPLPEQVFIYPLRDGQIELPRGIRIPYEPFLGTIATSPEIEAIATLVPGPFGGNMDVPDVCPGNTVRLPVSVEGAYFFTGDAHAAQGDGELCGVACEVTARVRLRLSVEKGSPSSGPASSRRPSSWPWAARGRWRTRPGSRGSS